MNRVTGPLHRLVVAAYLRLAAEAGQTLAEYGILVVVIAVVVIVAATLFGSDLSTWFHGDAAHV